MNRRRIGLTSILLIFVLDKKFVEGIQLGLIFLRAMYSLGFINVFRVLVYRLMLKALRCYSCKEYINIGQKIETQIYPEINKNERDYGTNDYSALIDWGYNVYTGEHVGSILAPWYCISDFECKVGIIKRTFHLFS